MQPTKTQLPATITQTEITSSDAHTTLVVPALIADVGNDASWRYVEFFTANIRNPHTRRAYARACARFFAWCEQRGLTLTVIRPFDVATYIEGLQQEHSAPGVKQQLAAVRMLFDWLITGQVLPTNPAAAVRGPKPSAPPGLPPTSPTVGRSSTRRKWRRTKARARPSSTIGPRSGLPRTRWRGSGCEH